MADNTRSGDGCLDSPRKGFPKITRIEPSPWPKRIGAGLGLAALLTVLAWSEVRDHRIATEAREHLKNSKKITITNIPFYEGVYETWKGEGGSESGAHNGHQVTSSQYREQFSLDNPGLQYLSDGISRPIILRDTNGDGVVFYNGNSWVGN
jgi:hypothetical protein